MSITTGRTASVWATVLVILLLVISSSFIGDSFSASGPLKSSCTSPSMHQLPLDELPEVVMGIDTSVVPSVPTPPPTGPLQPYRQIMGGYRYLIATRDSDQPEHKTDEEHGTPSVSHVAEPLKQSGEEQGVEHSATWQPLSSSSPSSSYLFEFEQPPPPPREYVFLDNEVGHPSLLPFNNVPCEPVYRVGRFKWLMATLPPVIFNPSPCMRPDLGPNLDAMCGCASRAVAVRSVYLYLASRSGECCPLNIGVTNSTNGRFAAVDRSSTWLNVNRCFASWGDVPKLNALVSKVVQRIKSNRVSYGVLKKLPTANLGGGGGGGELESLVSGVREAYYCMDNVAYAPGHSLEAIIEGLAQYYSEGLHIRRVPILVPELHHRNAFQALMVELVDILGRDEVPLLLLPHSEGGAITHLPIVWFANTRQGWFGACFEPFVRNVLYPRAMKQLRASPQGLPPMLRRIALMKLVGDVKVNTANRAMVLTPSFQTLVQDMGIQILREISIKERLFYVNTCELLITNYGGAATFNSLLRLRRGGRVLMLVPPGYHEEFKNFVERRHVFTGFSVTFPYAAPRTRYGGGYYFIGDGLKVKFLVVDTLDNVTRHDIESLMTTETDNASGG